MRSLGYLLFPAGGQPVQPVLPNGFEHRKADLTIFLLDLLHEALIHQRRHPLQNVNLEVVSRVANSLNILTPLS